MESRVVDMLDFKEDKMSKLIEAISVFFPAYNEQGNLENTVGLAISVLEDIADKWEVIIVDDGSTDSTLKVAEKLRSQDNRIRVVSHTKNRGYGASLKSGFYSSKFPWICFTDADGQFDFSEIVKLIEKQKNTKADLVIGYYLKRKVPLFTVLTSKIWELIILILFGLKVKDIDCGFKLISKEVIDKIDKLESERGAFISSELLIKAKDKGFKFTEIGVNHYPRKKGLGTGRKINVIIKSFVDLFRLWKKIKFSKK